MLEGDEPVAELWLGPAPGAGRRVMEAAHALLATAGVGVGDLDGVVVGVGPGGFTGLRIGIATALGLGQAAGIEVVGASSLEALALSLADHAPGAGVLVPVLDAKRRELFCAVYRRGEGDALEEVVPPSALAPSDLAAALTARGLAEDALVGGEGLRVAGPPLAGLRQGAERGPESTPRARDLVRRVRAGGARPAVPVYARLPAAEVNRRAREAGGDP